MNDVEGGQHGKYFLRKAMYHAAYLYSRAVSRVINKRTLQGMFFGHLPTIHNLTLFDCGPYTHIRKVNHKSKLYDHTERGV